MRYFICALAAVQLGIPAEHTQRIIPSARIQTAGYETGDGEFFISLPVLLGQKDPSAPHGLVLKTDRPSKTVLLTPRIDIDLEIPEDRIHRLPDVFAGAFRYFRGAFFNGHNVILIVNTEKLMEGVP
ncbi:MAG: hypothetical protein FWC64_10445 [Treponema sp.]|nr:hypothetical protein [Treponema sp.]